jgi:D-alanine-D-alanine ligase
MKIAIIFGGFSTERAISFQTAESVFNELKTKYDVVAIDLAYPDKDIELFNYCEANDLGYQIIDKFLKRLDSEKPDRIFNGLHGGEGENGQIQAVLELSGFKTYSCSSTASALTMDKYRSKIVVNHIGVDTGCAFLIAKEDFDLDRLKTIGSRFSYPYVVKANAQGSSVGVFIVKNSDQLLESYNKLKDLDDDIIVENYIAGSEFSVPILKGKALNPVEIEPISGFYDYENKYQDGRTNHYCPARLDSVKMEQLKELAERVYKILGCSHYARADFIMDSEGVFNYLEINSLPGMTKLSLMPESAESLGIPFISLLERIMEIKE